jgi:hypothetical protein
MGMNVSPEARREMIQKKAHELFVKKGSKPGHELDDWLEAERLVDRELAAKSSSSSSSTPATPPSRPEQTPASRPEPTPIRAGSSSKVGGYKRVP